MPSSLIVMSYSSWCLYAAFEMGVSSREICDHYHEIHRGVYSWFMIEFDHFGRTSTTTQTKIAQDIYRHLESQGMVLEETQEQLYSDKMGKFLADRYEEDEYVPLYCCRTPHAKFRYDKDFVLTVT